MVCLYLLEALASILFAICDCYFVSLSFYVCDMWPPGSMYQRGCLGGGMCEVLMVQRCIHTHVLMETRDVHTDILK